MEGTRASVCLGVGARKGSLQGRSRSTGEMGSGRVDFLRRRKSFEVHFITLFLATAAESVMYRFIAIYSYGSASK